MVRGHVWLGAFVNVYMVDRGRIATSIPVPAVVAVMGIVWMITVTAVKGTSVEDVSKLYAQMDAVCMANVFSPQIRRLPRANATMLGKESCAKRVVAIQSVERGNVSQPRMALCRVNVGQGILGPLALNRYA